MSTCPSVEQLRHFLGRELEPEALAAIESHLATCPDCPARRERLLADHDALARNVRVAFARAAETEPGPVAAGRRPAGAGAASNAIPQLPEGYEFVREISHGGQGIVYQAIQTDTKRKVAIKVLLEGAYASPSARRRFEREIELVASLKHPNIVAVFHSGQTADGRPFCVMDYVRGESLTAYVREKKLALEEALRLFGEVCAAVQYAHQKGVIHRDLKPSNILVDADGHPKVLDFGLAKQVGGPEQTLISLTGQVVGTLPYMSPEQARGNPDEIDTRTDVYALGVILYEMLTGCYPYPVVGQMAEVLKHIAETEPTPPSRAWKPDSGVSVRSAVRRHRRGSCPIDDEVQTIVLRALAKERPRRYASAGELARDVERYLKDEPIEAKRDSGWYVLRKQLRRYRIPAAVAAAFLVLVVAAGIISSTLYVRAEQRRQEALAALERETAERRRADVQRALAEKNEALAKQRAEETQQVADFQSQMLSQIDTTQAGVDLMKDIRERFTAALEQAGVPEAERRQRLDALGAELVRVNATDAAAALIDRTILRPAVRTIGERFKDQPAVDAQLRQALADLYRTIGRYDAAYPLQESALKTRRRVLGEEHADTLISISCMGVLLESQGNYAEAEPYYRDVLEKSRRVRGEEHIETLTLINNLGILLATMGRYTDAMPYCREAFEKRKRLFGSEHPETISSISNMGYLLNAMGKFADAETYHRQALEQRVRILGENDPSTITSMNNLGSVLQAMGRYAEAEPYFRNALEKRKRVLGSEHPSTLRSLNNLGLLLHLQGRFADAEPYYREALEKRCRVLGEEHPDTLQSINNIGGLLKDDGRFTEAEVYLRDALEKSRRVLGEEHPYALGTMNNLGILLFDLGELAEAEQHLRAAVEKRRRVLGEEHLHTLISISNMGALLRAMGRPKEAIALLEPVEPAVRRVFTGGNVLSLGRFLTYLGWSRVAAAEFEPAEANLTEAHAIVMKAPGATAQHRAEVLTGLVELYEAWSAASAEAEDDHTRAGRAAQAAVWRAKLAEWQASTQPAATN